MLTGLAYMLTARKAGTTYNLKQQNEISKGIQITRNTSSRVNCQFGYGAVRLCASAA